MPQTHAEFVKNNTLFRQSCYEAKLPPTTRQASKYRRKRGLAHTYRLHAKMALEEQRRQQAG